MRRVFIFGKTPADIFERLAEKLEGYREEDFPPLNWGRSPGSRRFSQTDSSKA
jgi:hypothetical protein